jgi:hypothetical protein
MLLRLGTVLLLAATLAGCDKCGNFIFSSQIFSDQACRGDMPRQQ